MVKFKKTKNDAGQASSSQGSTPRTGVSTPAVPQELLDELDNEGLPELEDDTFADEAIVEPGARPLEGPRSWAEVDTEELARVALHICSNCVPSTDHAEAASRLAMQAASLDTDTLDPLALGRVDTRQLQLIRFDRAGKGRGGLLRHGSVAGPGLTRMGSRRLTSEMQRMAADVVENRKGLEGPQMAALRNKVLPASKTFDAQLYLSTIHAETALEELEAGREALRAAGSERSSQLKALVKQNFDRFISCKTTIDDVHARLKVAEVGAKGGSAGASTGDVAATVHAAQEEAQRVFADVLLRAAESERIRAKLALLKQYDSLFRLPPRIRDATRRGDYEQVISDYRTAKALMPDMGGAAGGGVWQNLAQEVEKGVGEMAGVLTQRLRNPRLGLAAATEAISALLQLQADGAHSVQGTDPVALFIASLSTAAHQAMAGCLGQHQQRVVEASGLVSDDSLKDTRWRQQQSSRGAAQQFDKLLRKLLNRVASEFSPAQFMRQAAAAPEAAPELQPTSSSSAEMELPSDADIAVLGNESIWLELISSLTGMLVKHLPDFWQLLQTKLPALAFISQAAKQSVEAGSDAAGAIITNLLFQYNEQVAAAFSRLATPAADKGSFLAATRRVVAGFTALRGSSPPPILDTALDQVLAGAVGQAVGQMEGETAQLLGHLPLLEDWTPRQALVGDSSAPVSSTPARLHSALEAGMAQVAAVVAEAGRGSHEKHSFDPLGASADGIRHAFFAAFTAFAAAADTLLSAAGGMMTSSPNDADSAMSQQLPGSSAENGRKLLLLANCGHVRGSVLTQLVSKHKDLLAADGKGDAMEAAQLECCQDIKQVEAGLVQSYQASKAAGLEAELQQYLQGDGFDWASAQLPSSVREAAVELVNALAEVEAEVYSGAPQLRVEVMTDVLTHLLTQLSELLTEHLQGSGLGGCVQLLLELQFLEAALPFYASQPAVDELLTHVQEILVAVIQAKAGAAHSAQQGQLERWAGRAHGLQLTDRVLEKSSQLSAAATESVRMNVACFQEAAAGA